MALEWVGLLYLFSELEREMFLPLIAGMSIGIALSDFLTATVHWACDTWGSEHTPWLGSNLIRGFREHHRDPAAILDHDWIEVNGQAMAAGFLALTGLGAVLAGTGVLDATDANSETRVFLAALVVSLVGISTLTNQLHHWAHATRPPAIVQHLQRARIILSRGEHAQHHRAPHMNGYCISTGWLNRPLDAIDFWRRLERCITALSGVEPRKDVEVRH